MAFLRRSVIALLCLLTVLFSAGCGRTGVHEFSFEEYRYLCGEFDYQSDLFDREHHIGSRADAAAAAKEFWNQQLAPEETAFCEVYFDSKSGCWMIRGMSSAVYFSQCNPFYGFTGGVYNVIFDSQGCLLGAWRDK